MEDIQGFYRERSLLDREYGEKLRYSRLVLIGSALSRKYIERKAKKSAVVSVGDKPEVTPGSLERYSTRTLFTLALR